MFKKIMVHTRRSVKFLILALIAVFLIIGVVAFLYKPTYSVSINGEQVGYTENKSELQQQINEYIENGEGENIAFVQVPDLPDYTLCLLKKNITTNDDEIFEKVKSSGTPYYRYYAVLDGDEEKLYVPSFEEAEGIVNELKEKASSNVESVAIVEKYETEKKDFVEKEEAVSKLYVAPKPDPVKVASTSKSSGNKVNTSFNVSSGYVNLGISLIRPISGTISSRFGVSSNIRSSRHTGLDIAAPTGTPIAAAASGTVVASSYNGSYGNMIAISHGNGVQTYYGHCSKLYATVGQEVSQGETIAAVGSTGNSTGPHLHIEIRVNGVAYNPQNYLY